ncbi:MAG TPA: DUF5131 family protein, partial [Thermoleophilia bacterium]
TPTFHADRLDQPLHWRKPRRIGVSFMGDLFHEAITDEQIALVFLMMAQVPKHTYLVLTKRPDRARDFVNARIEDGTTWREGWTGVPLPNVHLGVTVCNQAEADRNVPLLLGTPAAVRWVSYEPAIGPVDFKPYLCTHDCEDFGLCQMDPAGKAECTYPKLDLIVLGGETGPGARPMQPEWALDVYRQGKAAGVAFWFKQWGEAKQATPIVSRAEYAEMVAMEATHELPAVAP